MPLHPDLATALAEAKPEGAEPTDRVFKTTPTLDTLRGKWFTNPKGKRKYQRGDLDRAGMDFKDAQGRCVDRHALRKTFLHLAGHARGERASAAGAGTPRADRSDRDAVYGCVAAGPVG